MTNQTHSLTSNAQTIRAQLINETAQEAGTNATVEFVESNLGYVNAAAAFLAFVEENGADIMAELLADAAQEAA